MRRNNKGVSLIELLVSFGMAGVIFVTVSSLLITLLTSNTKSRRQEAFEQVKNDLGADFSSAIRWGQAVTASGSVLIVDGTTYEVVGTRLTKQGEPITPENVEVTSFEVIDMSGSDDLASILIVAELSDASFNLAQDKFSITVSQRKTEIGSEL